MDRDYTNFVGMKASSGFVLDNDNDTNAYQDNEDDSRGGGGGLREKIHLPAALEDKGETMADCLVDQGRSGAMKRKGLRARRNGGEIHPKTGLGGLPPHPTQGAPILLL